jgi:hypothetical protein
MNFLLFNVSFGDLFPPAFVIFLVNKYLFCKMFNLFVIQGGFEYVCAVRHSAYF